MGNCKKNLFFMAKEGDISAFEKLIEIYERKIYSMVFSVIGNSMEASELTQDIFVRVFMELKIEESENKLSLLVYGTTRKMLLSRCKNARCPSVISTSFNMV